MSQTSDNSRTFRVVNLTDAVKTQITALKAVVTEHESINYVEVSTVADIAAVKTALDDAEMKYKQCSYSTFVRFKDQMTLEQLNTHATGLCENVNILYSRVDENNHTGKLVVDRLEDYNKLKSNTGDVSFYRFSPMNVPHPQTRNYQGRNEDAGNSNSNEWQTVGASGRPTVRGRYANAVAPAQTQVPQTPVVRATRGRGGAASGRGGATRGRGRPAAASV